MLKLSPKRRDKLIQMGKKLYRTDSMIKNRKIDFSKPWWKIFLEFPVRSSIVLFETMIRSGIESLLPLWIGLIIQSGDWTLAIWLGGVLILLRITEYIGFQLYQTIVSSLQYNVDVAAKRFFLTVDPEHHVTKSSGKIISKTSNTGREFMRLCWDLFYSLTPAISGFLAVLLALFQFDWRIGLIMGGFFVFITLITILGNAFMASNIVPIWIKARDAWTQVGIENLSQIWLIRSTFSVPEQLQKSEEIVYNAVTTRSFMNMNYQMLGTIIDLTYYLSVIVLMGWSINQVSVGALEGTVAIALVATYLNSSRVIVRIGSIVTSTVESFAGLNDMWDFIRNFGSQTYPVLPEDNEQAI
jgi:ABC-type multidrug transport system fused ATPase/permease subunit